MPHGVSPASLATAFALVLVAGLCAPLGACVVLLVKKDHTTLLAPSLSLAAGVMILVALAEVLNECMEELGHNWSAALSHLLVYLAFFFGVALCRVLDKLADVAVSIMTRATANKRPAHKRQRVQEQQCQDALQDEHFVDVSSVLPAASTLSPPLRNPAGKACVAGSTSNLQLAARDVKTNATNNANCSDLETGFCLDSGVSSCCPVAPSPPGTAGTAASPLGGVAVGQEQQQQEAASGGVAVGGGGGNRGDEGADGSDGCEDATEGRSAAGDDGCCQLMRTSILVWLALSLHNLPEGLGTFVGYMSSPHLGVTIAIAIAIHNIPEGIALGVPLFFATGSRAKAIGWAAASGLAEPLGALVGLALQMTGSLNPMVMGIVMACVAGVMTGVAFQELLPRAMVYDPSNRFTTHGVFVGMAVMAFSLMLLCLWDT